METRIVKVAIFYVQDLVFMRILIRKLARRGIYFSESLLDSQEKMQITGKVVAFLADSAPKSRISYCFTVHYSNN